MLNRQSNLKNDNFIEIKVKNAAQPYPLEADMQVICLQYGLQQRNGA